MEQYVVEVWDGLYKPTVSGPHRFFIAGMNQVELYLSVVPNSKSFSDLKLIAYYYSDSSYEAPYYNSSQRSAFITLDKDKYYMIVAFRSCYNWGSHFWVGVEAPSTLSNPRSIGSVQSLDVSFKTFRETQELKIYNYKTVGKFKIVVAARNPGFVFHSFA